MQLTSTVCVQDRQQSDNGAKMARKRDSIDQQEFIPFLGKSFLLECFTVYRVQRFDSYTGKSLSAVHIPASHGHFPQKRWVCVIGSEKKIGKAKMA